MDQRAGVWPVEDAGSLSSSGPAVPASDVAECISTVPVEERPRSSRLPLTTVTWTNVTTCCKRRREPRFKCNRDRWIGAAIVPTKGADEYAVAELKKDVICSGFTEVLVRSDNEPAILALKESAVTALKLAGVTRLKRVYCTFRKATDWPRAL